MNQIQQLIDSIRDAPVTITVEQGTSPPPPEDRIYYFPFSGRVEALAFRRSLQEACGTISG